MQTATRDGVGWKTNACTVTASFVTPKLVLRKPSIRMVYAGSIVRSRLHMHCYRRTVAKELRAAGAALPVKIEGLALQP
jgi:hypothetical protein